MNMLTHLAISNNKKNKTRSVLIIAAVFLCTMLLSVIAFFGYGAIKFNRINAEVMYGSFYGTYAGVTDKQVKEMELRGEFTDIGKIASVGSVDNEIPMSLAFMDETAGQLNNMNGQLDQGSYPKEEKEIAAQPGFFRSLGYENARVGDQITLKYRKSLHEKFEEETFIISGLFRENASASPSASYMGFVSQAYWESLFPEKNRSFSVVFRLSDAVSVNSDNAKDVMKELAPACGIDERFVSENSGYLLWALDPGLETIAGCAVLILMVILFSVVVIYNIFQVGIAQKVQEYGKIKAMGATKKQMKRIVFREGMLLAGCAVPFGLAVGGVLANILQNWGVNSRNETYAGLDLKTASLFSIPIALLCVALAFLTVWAALKKPMKIVSSISPVEAMRYQGLSGNKKGIRQGSSVMNVKKMTMASLSGNRRRTISTILTMGLSCVLFVVLANVVSNMDEEYDARKQVPYGQFELSLDYSKDDTAYPENNLDNILKQNPLDQSMLDQIRELDGVTEVKARKRLYFRNQDKLESVTVLDREAFDNEKSQGGTIGNLDYDTASEQNGILHGWSHFMKNDGYSINQELNLILEDGKNDSDYTATLQGAFGNIDADWAITEDTCNRLGLGEGSNGTIWVDCASKDREKVGQQLDQLVNASQHVEIRTYQDVLAESELGVRAMKLMTYAFLAIVGIIGFMNMANTMIISIITRKQELGVLQAVGMTNRQLNTMLQTEGLFFSVGTVIISLLIGIPCGYAFFLYAKENAVLGISRYQFPALEIGFMVAAIAILQIVLSFILSRNVKKESLVERIRYSE